MYIWEQPLRAEELNLSIIFLCSEILAVECSFNHSVSHKVIICVFKNGFKSFPWITDPARRACRFRSAVSVGSEHKPLIRDHKAVFVLENKCRTSEIMPAGFCFLGKVGRQCKFNRCTFVFSVILVNRIQTVKNVGVFVQKFHKDFLHHLGCISVGFLPFRYTNITIHFPE